MKWLIRPIYFRTPLIYRLSDDKSVAIERYGYMFRWLFIDIHFGRSTGKVFSLVRKLTDEESKNQTQGQEIIVYDIMKFEPYLMKLSSIVKPFNLWFGEYKGESAK